MLSATVLLFLSALHASTLLLTEARHSVSHVTTFVSDLAVSERFYIDVLQGVKENTLSTEDWVNSTYANSVPALVLEPHDQLRWSFVVYKNLMVQLVEIKSAKLDSEEKTTAARSPLDMMSSMMKGTALAFWLDDEVNVTEYMMYLEEKAHNLRVEGFSLRRPFLLSDTATTRQANEGITELRDASLTGLSIVYGTGPDGEIIKFIQLNNQSRHSFGRHYCEQKVVSVGYLERDDGKKSAQPACLCGDGDVKSADEVKFGTMYGVNHISMSTMNINQSVADFTELLGGHLIDDVQPSNMESDSLTEILTCDMPSPTGSENIMAAKMKKMMSTIRLNLRYILLDNVKIELSFITFEDPMMKMKMQSMMSLMTAGLTPEGEPTPGTTRIVYTTMSDQASGGSSTIELGPLAGSSYQTVTSQSGETYSTIRWGGPALKRYHLSLRSSASVSSLFHDLNPWKFYGYESYCAESRP